MITGTGTGVGKTVLTAAVAALAVEEGRSVAVLKPAQTGVGPDDPGDVDEVARLAGKVTARELARYPEPLAPATAARRSGLPSLGVEQVAAAATELHDEHDLVLVEGAGGLLVRFGPSGGTLADAAWALQAPVVLAAAAGLGTLNQAALSAEAMLRRGVDCLGVVFGSWPSAPDLAARCNVTDLPEHAAAPLLGALPDGMAALELPAFLTAARAALSPLLGGTFDGDTFAG